MRQRTVTAGVPKKLRINAVVRRKDYDAGIGGVRIAIRKINPRAGIALRIAASFLLCVAPLSQKAFARCRPSEANNSSRVSLALMRTLLESASGQWTWASTSDKILVHIQHQHMSCKEYARLYEKSTFYANDEKRQALARWHWKQYHSKDEATRAAVVSGLNTMLAALSE